MSASECAGRAQGADNNYIQLKGQGGAHEGTLCVMVKVDGAFTLLPVDEIIQLRTDMQRFNATEGKAAAAEDDPDYKPPPVKKETEKSVMRQLQVRAPSAYCAGRLKRRSSPAQVVASEGTVSYLVEPEHLTTRIEPELS